MDFCRWAEELWHIYLMGDEKDVARVFDVLDPDCVIIGTGAHEFYVGRDDFLPALRGEITERENISFHVQNFWCNQQEIGGDAVLVYGGIHIWWSGENGEPAININMDSRFSMIFQKKGEVWRLIHIHQSIPFRDQMDGEYYPKTLLEQVQEVQNIADEMTELAQRDRLTGVYNYMAFERIWKSWKRENSWIFLLDIDNFKTINDTWGHIAGNRVLQKISQILQDSVRKQDMVFRMGGDEFLLLCNDLKGQDSVGRLARRILERIRRDASEKMDDMWVTVSIGITDIREKDSLEQAVDRADQALYQVKRGNKGGYSCK